MNRFIKTDKAPAAIGPYSQGVVSGNLVFTAMQIGLNPATGKLAGDTIVEQAWQSLTNIKSIVTEAGGSMKSVVKVTIYLTDIAQFAAVNEIYSEFFNGNLPARGVAGVTALPAGARIAVEAIATIE